MAKKKVFSIGTALAQGLEETIESAQNHYGELRVDVLPLGKIETDPDNPRDLAITFQDLQQGIVTHDKEFMRKTEELEGLQSLAHSIKTQGIINPVTVYKHGERYRLIAGERRTLASILAGKTDIQARILDNKPGELKISLLQWVENMERTDLSLWERLKNLEKILAAHARSKQLSPAELSITEISQLIGCTKPHAMNYKTVLHADSTIRKLIAEDKIRNLEKAAVIADIEPGDVRARAIQACLEGATLKQLKTFHLPANRKTSHARAIETRGRQTTTIQLGMTKNSEVAKRILDILLNHHSLRQLAPQFKGIDWSNPRSLSEAFKSLLKKIETMHS